MDFFKVWFPINPLIDTLDIWFAHILWCSGVSKFIDKGSSRVSQIDETEKIWYISVMFKTTNMLIVYTKKKIKFQDFIQSNLPDMVTVSIGGQLKKNLGILYIPELGHYQESMTSNENVESH